MTTFLSYVKIVAYSSKNHGLIFFSWEKMLPPKYRHPTQNTSRIEEIVASRLTRYFVDHQVA
jgi:hypothetical protein